VNIFIIRTFVKLRRLLSENNELKHKLKEIERKVEMHDHEIVGVFDAIKQLMLPPEKPKRKMGFLA